MTRLLAAAFIAALALAAGTAANAGETLSPAQVQTCFKTSNAHPAGWPCLAFTDERLAVAFLQAKLTLAPGYKPRMRFSYASPRQITFTANKDGAPVTGVVVKTGPRRIVMRLTSSVNSSVAGMFTFTTPSPV